MMRTTTNYIFARLQERSTWQRIVAIVAAFGVTLDPAIKSAIIALGVAAAGLIHVLWPEHERATNAAAESYMEFRSGSCSGYLRRSWYCLTKA
jgi:hypothetical protein